MHTYISYIIYIFQHGIYWIDIDIDTDIWREIAVAAWRVRCGLHARKLNHIIKSGKSGVPFRVPLVSASWVFFGRLKNLSWKGGAPGLEPWRWLRKLMAKTGVHSKSRAETSFFFPLLSIQATSILVGNTYIRGGDTHLSKFNIRHTQSYARSINWVVLTQADS